MILTESNMEFDFSEFSSAEYYDTPENQCARLKIVDFVAENDTLRLFIEAKNYANKSDDPLIQKKMDKRQETDYRMLTDPIDAFPLEMGMKFKDSLLRWFASGNEFSKPIALVLVMNPPATFKARDIERLKRRVAGYIPEGVNTQLERFPKMAKVFFDLLNIEVAESRYGFSVSAQ